MQNESRNQPRIRATVEAQVFHPSSGRTRPATLLDLSWGGALARSEEALGEAGDQIEVRLPYTTGHPIAIMSEILRTDHKEDHYATAVRFTSLSTENEAHLEKVLDMLLSGSGGGRRLHPRLAQRLEVYFDDPADIKATLEDISRGGLSVTVPYSFSINQSVQLTIHGPAGFRELRLRARVVRQTPLNGAKLPLYRIGLEFEHPAKEIHDMIQHMLQRLMSREEMAAHKWTKK